MKKFLTILGIIAFITPVTAFSQAGNVYHHVQVVNELNQEVGLVQVEIYVPGTTTYATIYKERAAQSTGIGSFTLKSLLTIPSSLTLAIVARQNPYKADPQKNLSRAETSSTLIESLLYGFYPFFQVFQFSMPDEILDDVFCSKMP